MAAWLDTKLWSVLEAATDLASHNQGDRSQAGDFVVDCPVADLAGKSFHHWAIRLQNPSQLSLYPLISLPCLLHTLAQMKAYINHSKMLRLKLELFCCSDSSYPT